jgi:hypothetical protein
MGDNAQRFETRVAQFINQREDCKLAKAEDTQINRKADQNHKEGQAATPQAAPQPPAKKEVKARTSLDGQGSPCSKGGSEASAPPPGRGPAKGVK